MPSRLGGAEQIRRVLGDCVICLAERLRWLPRHPSQIAGLTEPSVFAAETTAKKTRPPDPRSRIVFIRRIATMSADA
jgi:hypothetical protein